MSRMIAQLTRTAGISGGSSADSGDDESDTEVTNTNNPALNRTSKKARFQVYDATGPAASPVTGNVSAAGTTPKFQQFTLPILGAIKAGIAVTMRP